MSETVEKLLREELDCCVDDVGQLIQNLVRSLQVLERAQISRLGFTISQCYTLISIQRRGEMTMNALSEEMNLDASTMTRIVSNLVRDGYLTRERSPEDGRVVLVKLTPEGDTVVGELHREVLDFYRKVIGEIPSGEVTQVVRSVNTLLQAFHRVRPFCC